MFWEWRWRGIVGGEGSSGKWEEEGGEGGGEGGGVGVRWVCKVSMRLVGELQEGGLLMNGRLVNAGRAGAEQPKRFYRFQLIDPVDQPFATFRYYCRSWEQLRNTGLLIHEYHAESEGEVDVIEPGEDDTQVDGKEGGSDSGEVVCGELDHTFQTGDDGMSVRDWSEGRQQREDICKQASAPALNPTSLSRSSSNREIIASGSYIPRGAPASEVSTGSPPSLRRRSRKDMHRLSVPPSIRLDAPDPTHGLHPVPQKSDISVTAYRPHPAYPIEEWTVRTPSPVRSVREGITTPPLSKRGLSGVGAGLMGVIQSTWKRSVSAAQATRKGGVGEEKRSVSY